MQKISPKFSCIKFFQIRDGPGPNPRDIPATPCLKQQKKATCIKFLSGMSRRLGPGCPRNILPKNFMFRLFFRTWNLWTVAILLPMVIQKRIRTDERQQKFITKIHANLVFQVCISFLRCVRAPGTPIRQVPYGILACYPVLSLDGLKLCKFVSRFLDADHSLDFLGTPEA